MTGFSTDRRKGRAMIFCVLLLAVFAQSVFANPLAQRAMQAAANRLTNTVMDRLKPQIAELAQRSPGSPEFKAELEVKLTEAATRLVSSEIQSAMGGQLPNPVAIVQKVLGELRTVAAQMAQAAATGNYSAGAAAQAAQAPSAPTGPPAHGTPHVGHDPTAGHHPAPGAPTAMAPPPPPPPFPAPREKPRLAIPPFRGDDAEAGEVAAMLFSIQGGLLAAYNIVAESDAEYVVHGRIRALGDGRGFLTANVVQTREANTPDGEIGKVSHLVAGGYRVYRDVEELPNAIGAMVPDIAAAAPHALARRPSLVVTPFKPVGADEEEPLERRVLSQILPIALANTGKYAVVSSNTEAVRNALADLDAGRPDHTAEERAMATAAASDGAEFVLAVEMQSLGAMNMLVLRILNARDGSLAAGDMLNYNTLENAIEQLPQVAERLARNAPSPVAHVVRIPQVTVSFNVNGGTPVSIPSATQERGTVLGARFPADPVRHGFVFDGWFTPDDVAFRPSSNLQRDVTLTARWSELPRFTVRFNPNNNGETIVPQPVVDYGGVHFGGRFPADPQRRGYIFNGWYSEEGVRYAASDRITKDMTLTARWTERFKVKTAYGLRLAHNAAQADVDIFYRDGMYPAVKTNDNLGHGVELGGVIDVNFAPAWSFVTGLNLAYRTPVNVSGADFDYVLSETAVTAPAFLRVYMGGDQTAFYLESGLQFELAFAGAESRNVIDAGFAVGAGFRVNGNVTFGSRLIWGAAEFTSARGQDAKLFQVSTDVTYMLGN